MTRAYNCSVAVITPFPSGIHCALLPLPKPEPVRRADPKGTGCDTACCRSRLRSHRPAARVAVARTSSICPSNIAARCTTSSSSRYSPEHVGVSTTVGRPAKYCAAEAAQQTVKLLRQVEEGTVAGLAHRTSFLPPTRGSCAGPDSLPAAMQWVSNHPSR